MKTTVMTLAAMLLGSTAMAQSTAPARPVPGAATNQATGTAAAAGDSNQAVATTTANAPQPAHGANSFSQGEARRRIEGHGFSNVTGLHKDNNGVWRGTGMKSGASSQVWLDYKGNVGTQARAARAAVPNQNPPGTAVGRATDNTLGTNTTGINPGANNPDGTPGNPPGTALGRATDRTLGTNTTGVNPGANNPDGTPGNPPGTAVGRAVDRTLGTNVSGANPSGTAPKPAR